MIINHPDLDVSSLWMKHLCISATTLSALFVGFPALAESTEETSPSRYASAIALSERSTSILPFAPMSGSSPEKTTVAKTGTDVVASDRSSMGLRLETMTRPEASPAAVLPPINVGNWSDTSQFDTLFSTAAQDLDGVVAPDVTINQDDPLLTSPQGEPLAQAEESGGESDLAAAAQNPVADLISLPFQNNTNFVSVLSFSPP